MHFALQLICGQLPVRAILKRQKSDMAETLGESREERRTGPKTRRVAAEDRRNAERVADDFTPRRNPDIPGRRAGDTDLATAQS